MNRFDYVKYDEHAQIIQNGFKVMFMELEKKVDTLLTSSRAKALALTSLEETYMWIGKAIRDDQLARNGMVELQEQRNNS
jgi:hypothetical protein